MGILLLVTVVGSFYLIYIGLKEKQKINVPEAPDKIEPPVSVKKTISKAKPKKPVLKKQEASKPATKKPATKKTEVKKTEVKKLTPKKPPVKKKS